jgi:hypothetical protein
MLKMLIVPAMLVVTLGGCALDGNYHQSTTMQSARVVSVDTSMSSGDWKIGAGVGAVAGLLTGAGHSTESKAYRAAAGGLAGAAVGKALTTGNQVVSLTLHTAGGQMMLIEHDHKDLRIGDCVSVETRSNGRARVMRTSPTQCNF